MSLTNAQREALAWANTVPLCRWTDGHWRGMGAKLGDDEFEHEDIRWLTRIGLLELMPIGAIITQAGRRAHGQQQKAD